MALSVGQRAASIEAHVVDARPERAEAMQLCARSSSWPETRPPTLGVIEETAGADGLTVAR